MNSMSISELKKWMDEGKDFILVDTLTSDHFEKVHLPGAVNACVFEVMFRNRIESIISAKDRQIILYGSSETSHDAATAAEKLDRLGYRNVMTLRSGIKAWREAGYPLEGNDIATADQSEKLRLEKKSYQIDTERSLIEWTGRNPNTKHFGTLAISKGDIKVDDGKITGSFEIDIHSIKNKSLEGDELQPVLIAHLLSDDFFFADKFPKVAFTIESAKQVEQPTLTAPNFQVDGTLSLRGVSGKIDFPATVSNLDEQAITAEAHFDIDRTRWNIIYGSSRFFEHLGMHVVFDLISLQVRIVAK